MVEHRFINRVAWALAIAAFLGVGLRAAPESKRLERAKDLIADEQWVRAVDVLKAAAADPKEPSKDEALFWLAHSYNQARDKAAAVETIRQLEREYPKSRWVKPAQSLRVEIAERLHRSDVLWYLATPPPPPVPPTAPAPPGPASTRAPRVPRPPVPPAEAPGWPPAPPSVPVPPAPPKPAGFDVPVPPPAFWVSEFVPADRDIRIQALGSLLRTDAARVIPILKALVLESDSTAEAGRLLFVLSQSDRPEARATVFEVARTGSEPARIAAVRELGRFGGPNAPNDLLQVYWTGNFRVKSEVVSSLGMRSGRFALMRIAETEADRELRDSAIVTLGEAGGLEQLRVLYTKSAVDAKRPIINGFFNAHAEEDLIRIADREGNPVLRRDALRLLGLLGTPRAKQYLERVNRK
jgi:hypothetical protein